MFRLTIQKNFFFSAGYKYDWIRKYEACGVGVAIDILKDHSEIEIEINNRLYTLDCNQAITFIQAYKSIESYKGKKVGIITKSLLKLISAPNSPITRKGAEVSVLQAKLF